MCVSKLVLNRRTKSVRYKAVPRGGVAVAVLVVLMAGNSTDCMKTCDESQQHDRSLCGFLTCRCI
jgi:hypothetical protein